MDERLKRFEYILRGAGLGSWDWYLDTNKVTFDRLWCEMLGLKLEETPQELSTWDSRLHPDDKAKAYADVKSYLDGKTEVYENIQRLKHADGHWVWILDRGRVSERDHNGKALRFTGTHLNISAYKEMEALSGEIQRIGNIGGWELSASTDQIQWTNQVYFIHSIEAGRKLTKADWAHCFPLHERSRLHQCFEVSLRGKKIRERFELVDAKGVEKWVELTGEPQLDANGKVYKVRGTIQDITDLVVKEKEAGTSSRFAEVILENIPSMVFVKNYKSNLSFSLFNKAGEELLGMKSESLIGKTDYDFFPKEQADFFTTKDRQVFVDGKILRIEREEIDTPKGKRVLSTFKVPTYDENGNPELLIGISNDITEEVAAKEALEQERSRSIQSSKLATLGEMAAGIAHEINNPLAIIVATSSILDRFANNPAKLQDKIATIQKSSKRIEKIVNGLRKFSRSSNGSQKALHSIGQILKEVVLLTESNSKRHSTFLQIECDSEEKVLCDEIEIEQVLVNLINNGIDAVKQLPEKWVKISVFGQGEELVVQVRDSGKGLPPSIESKLFQPFFTTKPVGEGTGLGLSIVKGILDDHQASIQLRKDEPNTCFEIRFPRVKVESVG